MNFNPTKNPTNKEIRSMIATSAHQCVRRIRDADTGDFWAWPGEQASHREGARLLGVRYEAPACGVGEVLALD